MERSVSVLVSDAAQRTSSPRQLMQASRQVSWSMMGLAAIFMEPSTPLDNVELLLLLSFAE